ncbi:MAG: transglutaminase family protein [Bacteroidales bacterium]|nr:transglutaminase family protein [Bacteroidales bacterium]MDZ4204818.1 transglutaminase family protein [Bacteroidales bacterium]
MAKKIQDNETKQTLKALLSLIDEPAPSVYQQIFDSILSMGAAVIPFLRTEIDNTFSPLLRCRLEELIQKIRFEGICNAIQRWKASENHDLIQFMKILARFHNPEMNHAIVENKLLAIKKDIWLELSQNLTSLESIRLVNHILFNIRKLKPETTNNIKPENFYLDQFLVSKQIYPMVFGAFYLGICQRLTLPVFFVNLPDNFLIAYTNLSLTVSEQHTADPLFYINPLMEGVAFNKAQIEHFLAQNDIEAKPQYFAPCNNLHVAIKLLQEAVRLYQSKGELMKTENIEAMIEILKS